MQGKTVTRKRLTNDITNISSEIDYDKSNTGVNEQTTVLCGNWHHSTVLAAGENQWNWKVLKDIEEEIETYMYAKRCQRTSEPLPSQTNDNVTKKQAPIPTTELKQAERSETFIKNPNPESQHPPPSQMQKNETDFSSRTLRKIFVQRVQIGADYIPRVLQKRKTYNFHEITENLDNMCLIFLQDTGGQPELMDCLPALTIGPSLYLLFCKFNTNLEKCYEIGYRGPDGKTSSLKSHFTIKETLLSALVSISSMQYSSSDDTGNTEQQTENQTECVYIIGTHRDKVDNDTVIAFETNLQQHIESTLFHKKGLIKEWYKNDFPSDSLHKVSKRLVYPLDNQFGEKQEIECLRKSLSEKINMYARRDISSQWLIFSIVLRGIPEDLLSLEDCFDIGSRLDMDHEQTEAALHFLHYNLGICMHFANVKELQHIVITNTQAIYDSLTTVIEAAFKPGIVPEAVASKFKDTGKFEISFFSSKVKTSIQLDLLVRILEHLNIFAPISSASKQKTEYFVPCILQHVSDEEITLFEKENEMSQPVSPLYIRFDCGFVPIGMFPALVANLIQQGSKRECEHIRLISGRMKRNYIQFSYGVDRDIITLIHKSEYIKIQITRGSDWELKLHQLCPKIRQLIATTIKSVSASMLHSLYTKDQYRHHFENYSFAFECYQHSDSDHLCTISNNDEDPRKMDCVKENNISIKLEPKHQVWYGKEIADSSSKQDATDSSYGSKPVGYPFTLSNVSLLRWTDSDKKKHRISVIDRVSIKWKKFSDILGLPPDHTKRIQKNNDEVEECCREVFVAWLDNKDGMYEYTPTWDGLLELLEDIELSNLAEEIKECSLLNISQSK